MQRKLTISTNPDWQNVLRSTMTHAKVGLKAAKYQGEVLNFETPGTFFAHLTERRWEMIHKLQGAGVVGVRELARRLGRDVKRVHEDAAALVELGLLERVESGALNCPYTDIHVDMHMAKQVA
ncbi:MAG: hypothetical protein EPN46_01545 [Candidimonas sp.]|nr:MAG: hypothetical protein B7X10_03615 [Burkholderiales bacterium 21-58-4]TAL89681.1 MAG: hypothetical protein EPN77_05020 [Candidimonas sp.]TAM20801.1 MAG: hypothetical protein EPN62_15815 [Candidimonas sp.]TAM80476.1 MAG: hypothetical protein EPN46_01545 [Candidimonas sp.]